MGILERIEEKLDALIAAGSGTATTTKTTKAADKGPTITLEQLVAQVTPLAGRDAATKAKVKEFLTSLGLSRLGEAQPPQFKALKDKFDELEAETAAADEEEDLV